MTPPDSDFFRTNLRPLVNGNQEKIAQSAGISRKHLSKILNGHVNPSLDVACRLAQAVETPLGTLVSGHCPLRNTQFS